MAYNTSASLFIGETFDGSPVFFEPHTAMYNNKPPGTVITGAPGSGKTFFSCLIAMNSVVSGTQTVILDPKGELISLLNMKDEVPDIKAWNLTDENQSGIVDPFNLVNDPGKTLILVKELLDLFTGGLSKSEETIVDSLIKDVIEMPNASLSLVVQELRKDHRQEARDLGNQLSTIREMPYARLCFGNGKKKKTGGLSKTLTVVTFLGLDLPKTPQEAEAPGGRLASGIIYLVTYLINELLSEIGKDGYKHPKMLMIDEAWQLLSSPYGAQLIESIGRLGRSLNISLILATQNNSDIEKVALENSISTRFAFSCGIDESESAVRDLQLPEGENFEKIFTETLGTGECIMKDFTGRYGAMRVRMWREEWVEYMRTNPKM